MTDPQPPDHWPENLTNAFWTAVNAPTNTESAAATLAFTHALAIYIRHERDDCNIPGSPATPDHVDGMTHAADLIDPEDE